MTELEDRLAAELRAESELIGPGGLRALDLSSRDVARGALPGRGGPRRWPGWVTPAAAAAAVAVVISGTIALPRLASGGPPGAPAPAWASYANLPPYYAQTIQGDVVSYVWRGTQYGSSVLGRHVTIRATATGKPVTTISPPRPCNDFLVLTGSADGRTFVLGAERYFGFRGHRSPETGALDPSAPVRFVLVRIDAGGRPHMSPLPLPFTVLPGQQPSISLSPDGGKLAVAYGGGGQDAILRMVTLATGHERQWAWPHAAWTPLLRNQGAWTADGRTLVLQQWYVIRGANGTTPHRDTPATTTPVWLLDTTAPGGAGGSGGRLLVLPGPSGLSAPWQPFITPDGGELVATATASTRAFGPSHGVFARYSTRTGALLRTAGAWRFNSVRGPATAFVAWSDRSGRRLLVLQPHDGASRLGVLAGDTVTFTGGDLLPGQPAAYRAMQSAFQRAGGIPPGMTW